MNINTKEFNDEAHEIWAMAQISSSENGEGIEDSVERIRKQLLKIVYNEIQDYIKKYEEMMNRSDGI
jgi:hypothetical protein